MLNNRSAKLIYFCFLFIAIGCEQKNQVEWEDPTIFGINKEPPRAHFFSYENLKLASQQIPDRSLYFQSLNGKWKFNFAKNVDQRPKNFFKSNFNDSNWPEIIVPGNWELMGWSFPIYLDEEYPFPVDPPFVPHNYNAVGSYRRSFTVSEDWNDREIFLKLGSVRSAFYLWINGGFVGYSQGSKTPAEFNITPFTKVGINNVSIEVYRFSDGSYLEGQDTWRVSGLERDVAVYARSKTRIADYFINADLDSTYKKGLFSINVDLINNLTSNDTITIKARLLLSLIHI